MAKELEYKLAVKDAAQLEEILSDATILRLCKEPWQTTPMKTTYYDTEDHRYGAKKWTIRQRQEGERSVVCIKTPGGEENLRNEWETEAAMPDPVTLERMVEAGAPTEILQGGPLQAVCGAEFLRRHTLLGFKDGSCAEIAGDSGTLYGKTERLFFTELELELKSGTPEQMRQLVQSLCQRFGLKEELRSKVARATALK